MAMTETAARHVAPMGIRVVAIAPGAIDTPLARKLYFMELIRLKLCRR